MPPDTTTARSHFHRWKWVLSFGVLGFVLAFFSIAMQEHHDMPWASVVVSAPASLLTRPILGDREAYLWAKIGLTGVQFAIYAWIITNPRIARPWMWVIGAHAVCILVDSFRLLG